MGERFYILMLLVFLVWTTGLLYTNKMNPHLQREFILTNQKTPRDKTGKPGKTTPVPVNPKSSKGRGSAVAPPPPPISGPDGGSGASAPVAPAPPPPMGDSPDLGMPAPPPVAPGGGIPAPVQPNITPPSSGGGGNPAGSSGGD